ncbi:MAG: SMI1/KNR4 family protein [Capsulimonas sp.]|uniref:SMI1/KNR4 family protein n=1 Tax=Capsulimonas sp. TaxID=2494211 RepID=UPI0032635BB0
MLPNILSQLDLRSGATEEEIQKLAQYVLTLTDQPLPDDYLDFLRTSNGAIGHGPDLFVNLRGAQDVSEATIGYGAAEFFPGLIIIGTDGCGNLIAVDLTPASSEGYKYILFDSLDLDREYVICADDTVVGLLEKF